MIFGVDNSQSKNPENVSNNFLVLDEEPTDGINDKAEPILLNQKQSFD